MRAKIKRDCNGNKILSIPGNLRGKGFCIQTNGNLPGVHRQGLGPLVLANQEISEIEAWLAHFGTYKQQRVFASFLSDGNNI